MEELLEQFNKILETEDGKKKFNEIAGALLSGDNSSSSENKNSSLDISSLLGMLGNNNNQSSSNDLLNGIDLNMVLKAQELLSEYNNDSNASRLLYAIKPYLKEERQQRVDQAVKLLKLIQLWPIIKESGLF